MEEEKKAQENTPVKATGGENTIVLQVAIVILLLVIVGLVYLIFSGKDLKNIFKGNPKGEVEVVEEEESSESEEIQQEEVPQKEDSKPTPAKSNLPDKDTIENIKAVLNTMNTQPMESYMAPKVNIHYNSPNPATSLEVTPATLSMDYLSDAKTPWTFPLSDSEKAKYASKAGFENLFDSNCLVGRSANSEHLVSFCYNEDIKIHTIFYSRDLSIFN